MTGGSRPISAHHAFLLKKGVDPEAIVAAIEDVCAGVAHRH
jgi:hypothetical protein